VVVFVVVHEWARGGVPLLIVLCFSVVFGLGSSDLIRINVEEVMVCCRHGFGGETVMVVM
jgi:hypothetical protein